MSFKNHIKDVKHISLQKEYFLNHYERWEEYYGGEPFGNWHDYHRRKWSRIRKIGKRKKVKSCRMWQGMNSTQETMFGQCGRGLCSERQ